MCGVLSLLKESTSSDINELREHMVALVSSESGLQLSAVTFQDSCNAVVQVIQNVIQLKEVDVMSTDPYGNIEDRYFQHYEEAFRGKVLSSVDDHNISELYESVKKAAADVCVAVNEDFKNFEVQWYSDYDVLAMKIPVKKSKKPVEENDGSGDEDVLKIPFQRLRVYGAKQKVLDNRVTSKRVEDANVAYMDAVGAAVKGVEAVLEDLNRVVYESIAAVTQASHWAVIQQAAIAHTAASLQKGWVLPIMLAGDDTSLALDLKGLSPYWLDRSSTDVQANDLYLEGVILLTAPNMSGKSTLMRSALVTGLLANCGMFVPCSSARVARFDTFFLRTASFDVPSEGKSAFGLEMDDLRVALRDCTNRSIVMLDEIGMWELII
jgi:DNA mismatch repair ATPase MutS